MNIYVLVKQIGKRKPIIGEHVLQLQARPETLQQFIQQVVKINVEQYNNRTVDELLLHALTEQDIKEQSETGKVGFGVRYNPNQQDLAKALENAELSFRDGLYKVFINETEVESWDAQLALQENDRVLFLKLTMLAGRMW
ncbi:hypothetical protein [Paenibacillus taihuensis]|uniref:hypothetical protein n=1 Tax=Paenibacillus taihuensis TaxID=1156355 RepID=UPI0011C01D50|nr:hypothetical protein [Paenibacillus taihuensis]